MFGVDDLISGVLGAGASMINNQSTNETNMAIAQQANAFNAAQAGLNRQFQHGEAQESMAFSRQEADIARQFNQQEAQKARDYTTMMANTAYQRQVADMKAAGINPILAAYKGGGADTPGGSQAAGSPSPSGSMGAGTSTPAAAIPQVRGVMDNVISNAMELVRGSPQVERSKQEVKTEGERTGLTHEQAVQAKTAAAVNTASAAKIAAEKRLVEEQIENEKRRQSSIGGVNIEAIGPALSRATGASDLPGSIRSIHDNLPKAASWLYNSAKDWWMGTGGQ